MGLGLGLGLGLLGLGLGRGRGLGLGLGLGLGPGVGLSGEARALCQDPDAVPPVDLVLAHPAARQPVRGVDHGDRHLGSTTRYTLSTARPRRVRVRRTYSSGPPERAALRLRHARCAGGRDAHPVRTARLRHCMASHVSSASRLELGAVAAGRRGVALYAVLRRVAQRGGRATDTAATRGGRSICEGAGFVQPLLRDDDLRTRWRRRGAALLAGVRRSCWVR